VGDHIKRARLTRKLTQAEAGKVMKVSEGTVFNWERNRRAPPVLLMPSVIRFLGYDPYPPAIAYATRFLAKRRREGWTIKEAARRLGINEATWGLYEAGRTVPSGRLRIAVDAFLAGEFVTVLRRND
jgi:transcriptional regulator with XRE-family HTH domain